MALRGIVPHEREIGGQEGPLLVRNIGGVGFAGWGVHTSDGTPPQSDSPEASTILYPDMFNSVRNQETTGSTTNLASDIAHWTGDTPCTSRMSGRGRRTIRTCRFGDNSGSTDSSTS